jgi:hypothetical protein
MCPKSTPIYVTHIILHPKTKLQESKGQIEEISYSVHKYRTMNVHKILSEYWNNNKKFITNTNSISKSMKGSVQVYE